MSRARTFFELISAKVVKAVGSDFREHFGTAGGF
jgi:hypothetical protein